MGIVCMEYPKLYSDMRSTFFACVSPTYNVLQSCYTLPGWLWNSGQDWEESGLEASPNRQLTTSPMNFFASLQIHTFQVMVMLELDSGPQIRPTLKWEATVYTFRVRFSHISPQGFILPFTDIRMTKSPRRRSRRRRRHDPAWGFLYFKYLLWSFAIPPGELRGQWSHHLSLVLVHDMFGVELNIPCYMFMRLQLQPLHQQQLETQTFCCTPDCLKVQSLRVFHRPGKE